jgi:hypothetical protein
MDHATTTDADALLAEVGALLEQAATTDARVDALLDGWTPRLPTALRRLQRTARHTSRLSDLVERQQAALAAQLDAIPAMGARGVRHGLQYWHRRETPPPPLTTHEPLHHPRLRPIRDRPSAQRRPPR